MTKVNDDAQAFLQVRGRLEGDVGGIFALIDAKPAPGQVPFWALVRMMFPVAEAIGDLIHHAAATGTADALIRVLSTEFEAARPGYKRAAALLTLLYRHSLTHQDEMRRLRLGGKEVDWQINYSGPHVNVTKTTAGVKIEFGCKEFYSDLVAVLKTAEAGTWGGVVKDQYNSWLEFDLDAKKKAGERLYKAEKDALAEIALL